MNSYTQNAYDDAPEAVPVQVFGPVIELAEEYLTRCAGRHKARTNPSRGCPNCGRAWCGVHADPREDHRCRGCGRATIPLRGATIRMKASR